MKIIFRSLGVLLLLLIAFAMPLSAQNPNVAIRLDAGTGAGEYCVKGSLKNLTPAPIAVSYIELWIYDAKTCKRICVTRKVINRKIKSCDMLDFDLCCKNPSPAFVSAIYYVRVHHSSGINEAWAFTS
ncbi:MAG: hypothetical protein QOG23_4403 [Blastocatellia bacterium]|jgi:hypothetical protein|nr:hypothetical protein [Blastocatellia bacterium]